MITARALVVLVTVPTQAAARRLAQTLVRKHLAACVNLVPGLESFFSWQGKLDSAKEILLIIKTTTKRYPALQRAVKTLHPYEVPEIIALPVTAALPAYLRWVRGSVS